jgi:uncharacterized membrane protein YbhN (UPF0104 family)
LSIGLLWILLRSISWDVLAAALRQANPTWVVCAIVVGFARLFLSAVRWHLLIKALDGLSPSLIMLTNYYVISVFFNNLAPANLAGDAARIGNLFREERDGIIATSSVVLERVLNLAGLCVLCAWALIIWPIPDPLQFNRVLIATGIVGLVALIAGLTWVYYRPPAKLQPYLSRIEAVGKAAMRHPSELGQAVIVTGVLHFVTMLVTLCTLQAVSIQIPITIQLAVYAIAGLAIALPISIQGIGVREAVYVSLFAMAGVAPEDTLAALALNYLVLAFFSILGGVLFWLGPRRTSSQVG